MEGPGRTKSGWGASLVDHHRPGMIHLAVLDVGERFADELVDRLLLLHGGYVEVLAEVVDPVDRTNHTGSAGAKQFQQLKDNKNIHFFSRRKRSSLTYPSLVEELADLWHGYVALGHLELAPLAGHAQDGVASDARQDQATQWRGDQFLFCKKDTIVEISRI